MSTNFKMLLNDIDLRSLELQEKHHGDQQRQRQISDLQHNRDFYKQAAEKLAVFGKSVAHAIKIAPIQPSTSTVPVRPDSSKLHGPGSSG